jgi:hypothetical protein
MKDLRKFILGGAIIGALLSPISSQAENIELAALSNGTNSHQLNLETQLDFPVDLFWGFSYLQNNNQKDALLNFRLSETLNKGNTNLTPYLMTQLQPGITTNEQDPWQNNWSYGIKLKYEFSKKLNAGLDIRKINYNSDSLNNHWETGISISIHH